MALFGRIETVRGQAPMTEAFRIGWQYVAELMQDGSTVRRRLLAMSSGASEKHDLGGGVFVIEQAYGTKRRPDGFFESHRKYIDIQVVVAGAERMEVLDLADAVTEKPYDPERDLLVHRDHASVSALHVGAGQCAVFFPEDVHMPSLTWGGASVVVHKAVLKLPVKG
jgi:YhcH/YjgK/YiaL family protein